jgi:serine protease
LEVISTIDGFKDYAEVEVTLKPSVLAEITPNPASEYATISYKLNEASSAYLMVLGYYGGNGTSNNYILDVTTNETKLNISNYQSGFYTVALVVNGKIIDAKTLIKQ